MLLTVYRGDNRRRLEGRVEAFKSLPYSLTNNKNLCSYYNQALLINLATMSNKEWQECKQCKGYIGTDTQSGEPLPCLICAFHNRKTKRKTKTKIINH